MSLLLDALKRSEQEKQARQQGERESTAAAALELQPLAQPASNAAGKPEASGARSQAALTPVANDSSNRRWILWAAAGSIVLVIAAIVGYVWYSISSLSPQSSTARRVPAPKPIAPSATDTATRFEPIVRADATPPRPSATVATPEPKGARPAVDSSASAAPTLSAAAMPAAAPPLRLERSAERTRVSPELLSGYEALRSGDLAAARRSYASALGADPGTIDALLGLATLEARSGNRAAATVQYRKALDLDPGNSTALAGLAALADFSRPEALETQLRAEIARDSGSAALQFTLGNLYASQKRWGQAQLAYFEAHRLDPAGPDILHNLAVSLDQMGQRRLAAENYRRALEAARLQAAQFDPASVARRLEELGPTP